MTGAVDHRFPVRADGTTEVSGHDLDAECPCHPEVWNDRGLVVMVHQLVGVRRCFVCGRDVDRQAWPLDGFLCGHCDDVSMAAARG